jgi:transketolase
VTAAAPAGEPTWRERHRGATRDDYRRTLLELAREDPRINCLDSDMGGLEETFQSELPAQYVNLGIAEANMMTVAAGLASAGRIVFVNTMASFATLRAGEQLKLDVAGNDLPVKLVVTHAGAAAGHFGPSHFAMEDVAVVRALPNMTVICPADVVETIHAVRAAAALPGPVYVRLGRSETGLVYEEPYDFQVGRAVTLRAGRDVAIVVSGAYPALMALEAHAALVAEGIGARVINVHTIKPIDREALLSAASETSGIVTVEDHCSTGGLGGAVAEVVSEACPCRVIRVGMPDRVVDRIGSQRELLERGGVSPARIRAAALVLCGQRPGASAVI